MPSVAGVIIVLRLLGLLQLPELLALDQFYRWRPPTAQQHPIVIVGVQERDLNQLRQWPMSDQVLANLLTTIAAQHPVAIGLDIYRPFPVPPGTPALEAVFRHTPNLIGVQKVLANDSDNFVAPPPLLKEANQVGAVDILADLDGRVRRGLLSIDKQSTLYNSLPLQLALLYLAKRNITPQPLDQEQTSIQLGKARFTPLTKHDGSYVGIDAGGYQVMINYWGRQCVWGSRCILFPMVSVTDVLNNRIPRDFLRDRVVLIGSVAESLKDFFATPFSDGERSASTGVEIHAELTSQIISAALDGRPSLRFWADPVEYLWIVLWASVGAILGWTFRWQYLSLVGLITCGAGLVIGAYAAFLAFWWIPVVPPLMALTGAAILSRLYVLASSLKQSYVQLADYSQQLELKVHERTRDLELEIQERKQAEEALRLAKEQADTANRAKSVFLSKMSHELRTPLNAILGFTQVLHRDPALQPEQRSYLDIISRSGEHLLSLINDVLDMSKIEAGKVTLTESIVDLHSTIEAIGDMLQLKASSKGLHLSVHYTPDLPRYVKLDEGKLRQILINLLGNAIKFTQQGAVMLRVGASPWGGNPPCSPLSLCFEVEDTGPGIAPHELGLLFSSFSQTETGRKSQEGSGLGLSISQQFVQLMGGTIAVHSVVGSGTTFTVTIPVQLADPAALGDRQRSRQVLSLAPDQPPPRILVAEDRPENQDLLVKLLTMVGFHVQAANNGADAVQQWETWAPHLIWMDMQMPVMDGYAATRQIRQREQSRVPSHKQVPAPKTVIIAITASAFEDEKPQVLAAGCDDLVLKPFREDVIFTMISQYLGVRYRYADETSTIPRDTSTIAFASVVPPSPTITPTDLSIMSTEWIANLRQAALCTDDEWILQLVADIPDTHAAIAQTLLALVNRFRFDEIIQLTTQITTQT